MRASIRSLAVAWMLVCACGDDAASGATDAGHTDGAIATDAGKEVAKSLLDGPLPFEVAREASGAKPSAGEVADFTTAITGLWKDVGYFEWLGRQSHGLHASYDPNMPDFELLWQDFVSVKEGDTITYRHVGGADNLMIRTGKVFVNAAAGYLASGDERMRALLVGYAKGIVALMRGASWGNQDPPVETIMVRALFTHDHAYQTTGGRKVAVDYGPMRGATCESHDDCPGDHADCPPDDEPTDGHEGGCCRAGVCTVLNWNAHTVPNPENPFYGDIWIRNMRSKDDVPHIFRVVPWLRRLASDAPDGDVRESAQAALDRLVAMAADIVDSGYQIRTIEEGRIYVPTEDLASFVKYDALTPTGECNPKLITALIGHDEALGNDCGSGLEKTFEDVATAFNYYNYAIVRYFHLTAITNALAAGDERAARALLDGLVERAEIMAADTETRVENPEWDTDAAAFLLAAAASGLPLTEAEAALIREQYRAAIPFYQAWPLWDLWDASVPDGEHPSEPSRRDADGAFYVEAEELAFLLEYCRSPWRAGAEVADCESVLDPARWGE
jgi:hypothetical protein